MNFSRVFPYSFSKNQRQNLAMYEKLDKLIIQAVRDERYIHYALEKSNILNDIVLATGREKFRIIDGRMAALKKQGKIAFKKEHLNNGSGGWHVV